MKKSFLSIVTLVFVTVFGVAHGETVRILSANDMHSAIEKMPQLAAIVDSLRAIDPFVLIMCYEHCIIPYKLKKTIISFIILISIAAQLVCLLPSVKIGAETSDPRKAYEEKLKAAQDQKAELEKKKKEQEDLIAEFTEEKENIETYIQELDLKLNDIT